ncbi:AraC family transcriptional regulator [Kocuria palustris]|uniref:helix-turn-helix transcriptional regulator n=1 Tax=Kocuria palustris TaxID=71999 RepID=UPI0011AB1AD3|nr:AraC family transcriptional regulator [Kocuria palustris]
MVEHVRAWHPDVPSLREVYHARFAHAYPMHTHDDWAVMLVDDGAVAYDLGRGSHCAMSAALTLLPPGIPHDGRPAVEGTGYRKRVLYLEAGWLPQEVRGLAADRPTLPGPLAVAAARRVHRALQEPGDPMAAEHWLLAVRDHVLRHLGRPAPVVRDAPLARRLRALLDDRLTESFTITEAAAQLGAHPSHLVRVFSRTYGIAPHQYQISRRVDLARHLLLDGHRPAETAALAGFHDQSHLARHFRRVLGTAPSTFTGQAGRHPRGPSKNGTCP